MKLTSLGCKVLLSEKKIVLATKFVAGPSRLQPLCSYINFKHIVHPMIDTVVLSSSAAAAALRGCYFVVVHPAQSLSSVAAAQRSCSNQCAWRHYCRAAVARHAHWFNVLLLSFLI
jgi:hypothetical protein